MNIGAVYVALSPLMFMSVFPPWGWGVGVSVCTGVYNSVFVDTTTGRRHSLKCSTSAYRSLKGKFNAQKVKSRQNCSFKKMNFCVVFVLVFVPFWRTPPEGCTSTSILFTTLSLHVPYCAITATVEKPLFESGLSLFHSLSLSFPLARSLPHYHNSLRGSLSVLAGLTYASSERGWREKGKT